MDESTDAKIVIDRAFAAIEGDASAALVAAPLRAAWNGSTFDEDALRAALATIADEESAS